MIKINRIIDTIKFTWLIVALIFTLILVKIMSINVLMVGSWPHGYLSPVYNNLNMQYSWAENVNHINKYNLNKFDYIFITNKEYEWFKNKSNYDELLKEKGNIVVINESNNNQYIKKEYNNGVNIFYLNLEGYNSFSDKSTWNNKKIFLTKFFNEYSNPIKKNIFYIAFFLFHLIIVCIFFKARRMNKILDKDLFYNKEYLKTNIKKRDIFIIISIGFFVVSIFYIKWIWGLCNGFIPDIEEGLCEVPIIQYIGDCIKFNGYLPTNWDFRTYSLPMDISFYQRTVKDFLAVIFYLMGFTAMQSMFIEIFLGTVIAYLLMVMCTYKIYSNIYISIFAGLTYISLGTLFYQISVFGHIIYLWQLILLPAMVMSFYCYWKESNRYWLVVCFFVVYLFTKVNTNIAAIAYVSYCVFSLMYNFKINKIKINKIKVFLFIIITMIPFILYIKEILVYSNFFNSPKMEVNSILLNESNNYVSMLFLSLSMTNGNVGTLANMNIFNTFIASFPIVGSILILCRLNKIISLGCISLLLLSLGLYGPFSFLFEYMHLPARAPARTFIPVVSVLLIIFFSKCIWYLLLEYKLNNKKSKLIIILLSILIVVSGAYQQNKLQRIYKINTNIEQVYQMIPKNSRVLMLPLWGNASNYPKLGYKNNDSIYKDDITVGYSLVHQHEYLSNEYNLKNAYSTMGPWEVLKSTYQYFEYMEDKMKKGEVNEAILLLKSIPDLQYIIVYKELISEDILKKLVCNSEIVVEFQNDTMVLLKMKNATIYPVVASKQGMFVSSSYNIYDDTVLQVLTSGKIPIFSLNQNKIDISNISDFKEPYMYMSGNLQNCLNENILDNINDKDMYYVKPKDSVDLLTKINTWRFRKDVFERNNFQFNNIKDKLLVLKLRNTDNNIINIMINGKNILLKADNKYKIIEQINFNEDINELNFPDIVDSFYLIDKEKYIIKKREMINSLKDNNMEAIFFSYKIILNEEINTLRENIISLDLISNNKYLLKNPKYMIIYREVPNMYICKSLNEYYYLLFDNIEDLMKAIDNTITDGNIIGIVKYEGNINNLMNMRFIKPINIEGNDENYKIKFDNDVNYIILNKSYFPFWKLKSNNQWKEGWYENHFLTGFKIQDDLDYFYEVKYMQ